MGRTTCKCSTWSFVLIRIFQTQKVRL
jgi:hypothetical protein